MGKPRGTITKRACDACRTGKRKCDGDMPCSLCTSKKKECTYDLPQAKRGGKREAKKRKAEKPLPQAPVSKTARMCPCGLMCFMDEVGPEHCLCGMPRSACPTVESIVNGTVALPDTPKREKDRKISQCAEYSQEVATQSAQNFWSAVQRVDKLGSDHAHDETETSTTTTTSSSAHSSDWHTLTMQNRGIFSLLPSVEKIVQCDLELPKKSVVRQGGGHNLDALFAFPPGTDLTVEKLSAGHCVAVTQELLDLFNVNIDECPSLMEALSPLSLNALARHSSFKAQSPGIGRMTSIVTADATPPGVSAKCLIDVFYCPEGTPACVTMRYCDVSVSDDVDPHSNSTSDMATLSGELVSDSSPTSPAASLVSDFPLFQETKFEPLPIFQPLISSSDNIVKTNSNERTVEPILWNETDLQSFLDDVFSE